jgi:hypothetical protein
MSATATCAMARGVVSIPTCWPVNGGACGDGHGHIDKDIGKAALVAWKEYVHTPPSAGDLEKWCRWWPLANWAELLEPAGVVEVDVDSDEALGEATALGLPPAPAMRTANGRRYRYLCPPELRGIRTTRRGHSRHIDILSGGYVIVQGQHRLGPIYEWIVSPDERPPSDAPRWALDMLRSAGTPTTGAVADLTGIAADVNVDALAVSPRMRRVIAEGGGPTYPSRSEALHAVTLALIGSGYTDNIIAGILLDDRNGISAKPRQKGRRWLAHEIARARRKRPVGVL